MTKMGLSRCKRCITGGFFALAVILTLIGCRNPQIPEIPKLVSIQLDTRPTKMEYFTSDTFDPSGITVTAYYSDGSEKKVTDWTTDGQQALQQTGLRQVTVSYTENDVTKTTSFSVMVYAVKMSSIAISTLPDRTVFHLGDIFTTEGMELLVTYNDGSTKTVDSGWTTDGDDVILEVGEVKTVTVSYTENDVTQTVTYQVNVDSIQMTGITLVTLPSKLNYYLGESFTTAGMELNVSYNNGTTETVTSGWTTDGEEIIQIAGLDKIVTITYSSSGLTLEEYFTVNVYCLDSVQITRMPQNINYFMGDTFSAEGLELTATYTDGTSQVVTGWTTDGDDAMQEIGTRTVTVSYTEYFITKTDSFSIHVNRQYYSTPQSFWGTWIRTDDESELVIRENSVIIGNNEYRFTAMNGNRLSFNGIDMVKESDNVATINNACVFKSTASDISYSVNLVGFLNGSSTAERLGTGYTATVSCPDYPSYTETVDSDSNGTIMLHSPVSNVKNVVTIQKEGRTLVTVRLYPAYAGQNLGTISIPNEGNYAIKITGSVEDRKYLYAGDVNTLPLSIENISDVTASYSLVELSSNDPNLSFSPNEFNIASINKGMVRNQNITISYPQFKAPYVNTSITITFTDARTGNSWTDELPIRFFSRNLVEFKAESPEENVDAELKGFIKYPDGNGSLFRVKHGETRNLVIPNFPESTPYKVFFAGAQIGDSLSESTEMKYSFAVNDVADDVSGTFSLAELMFGESDGGNDSEWSIYSVGLNNKIKGYLGYDDRDFFEVALYNPDIPYTVIHKKQNAAGSYVESARETLTGYVGSLTEAVARNYEGFKVQPVEQKYIDNFADTVVELKYDPILTGLTVSSGPSKQTYLAGENLDTAGLVVKAQYYNGRVDVLPVEAFTTDAAAVLTKCGVNKVVTVTYSEGTITKTAAFTVTVNHYLTGIRITKNPTKTSYYLGETYTSSGMQLQALYNDGDTKDVTSGCTTDGDKAVQKSGTGTVTVTYTESGITKTTGYAISVLPVMSAISISKVPDVTSYILGDTFTAEGMELLVSYNDGSTKTITSGWTTDGDTVIKTAGTDRTVTVTYTENNVTKTVSFNIVVTPVLMESINVSKAPSKTTYYLGDTFTYSGMELQVTYNNGTTKRITSGWTTDGDTAVQKSGTGTVTVTYTESGITKTTGYAISVLPVMSAISISKVPDVSSYYLGDTFTAEGMELLVSYNDGSTKTITSGWTTDGDTVIKTVGTDRTVTVTYTEEKATKTCTFRITVRYPSRHPDATYVFHDEITVLVSGTTGTNKTDSTYVYFGDWPQTIKSSSITVDESKIIVHGGNTYYVGSDGNYYAKCKENAYYTGSVYSTGTKVKKSSENSYAYFKVEPIKWRVLDTSFKGSGNYLLLAEDILMSGIPYYESSLNHRNGSYPNNYKDSQIRAYLNGISYDTSSTADANKWLNTGFLQSAFTETARNLIVTTRVDNTAASTTDIGGNITKATSYACSDTQDKVFLLSEYEVTTYSTEAYNSYGVGNSRIRKPTDFALANCCYMSSTSGYGGTWWLRSPICDDSSAARRVDSDGDASSVDYIVLHTNHGIVPALVVAF